MRETDEAALREVDAFYERVYGILTERGLEWKDLSRRMGMNDSTFTLMREERCIPSVFLIRKIADALGVSYNELFAGNRVRDSLSSYLALPKAESLEDDHGIPCLYTREVAYYRVEGSEEDGSKEDLVWIEELDGTEDSSDDDRS